MRNVCEVATPSQDAATFPLGCPTPYAMLDAVQQGVLETLDLHGTSRAHTLRRLDAGAVRREELGRINAATARLEHPRVFVGGFLHAHLHFNEPYGVLVPLVHIEPKLFFDVPRERNVALRPPTVRSANSQLRGETLERASCCHVSRALASVHMLETPPP